MCVGEDIPKIRLPTSLILWLEMLIIYPESLESGLRSLSTRLNVFNTRDCYSGSNDTALLNPDTTAGLVYNGLTYVSH